MKVLGIETSCDDTGIAIYDSSDGLITNELHSQSDSHTIYGGIVPELAARIHMNTMSFFLEKIFKKKNYIKY